MHCQKEHIHVSESGTDPCVYDQARFVPMSADMIAGGVGTNVVEGTMDGSAIRAPDATYIATANPSTVLALVARIRELEAALGEACEIGDVLLSVADELGGVELPHTESDLERFRALLPR